MAPEPPASTRREASTVNAAKVSHWTAQASSVKVCIRSTARTVVFGRAAYYCWRKTYKLYFFTSPQMWMSVAATTAVSTAARTCWEATAAAARRVTCSTTSGTSVWVSGVGTVCRNLPLQLLPLPHAGRVSFPQMRTSVRVGRCAAPPPVTTRWAASSACVLLASTMSRVPAAART